MRLKNYFYTAIYGSYRKNLSNVSDVSLFKAEITKVAEFMENDSVSFVSDGLTESCNSTISRGQKHQYV